MHSRMAGLCAVLVAGCGLTLDLDPPDVHEHDAGSRDAGRDRLDAGAAGECEGARDGTPCGEENNNVARICVDGRCVRSRCGDGFVNAAAGEECDDTNEVSLDGCEPGSCVHTCALDSDCTALDPTCSPAMCTAEHVCTRSIAPDETRCTTRDGAAGRCAGGACIASTCGDGRVDEKEECDDGNFTPGDGCEPDCTLGCTSAEQCDDGIVCNGAERCESVSDGEGALCAAGHAPPLPPCTECDVITGQARLVDSDGDGYASSALAIAATRVATATTRTPPCTRARRTSACRAIAPTTIATDASTRTWPHSACATQTATASATAL